MEMQEHVLVAEWDEGAAASTAQIPLTGEAILSFCLPGRVVDCSFLSYREGQLLGRWRLLRETEFGGDQWKLISD